MSEVRAFDLVHVSDVGGLADLTRRAADYIEQHLPGTLAWEIFVDGETGRGLMYQLHASQEAVDAYEQAMIEQGFQREIGSYATLDEIIMLSPVTDEQKAEYQQFGPLVAMDRIAGVTR